MFSLTFYFFYSFQFFCATYRGRNGQVWGRKQETSLCDIRQRYVEKKKIVQYYTILHYIILYYTIQYSTIQYNTILYYTILNYTILYYIIPYYTIKYYTILYYTMLYSTAQKTCITFSYSFTVC